MVKVGAPAAPPHASNTTFVHFILKLSPGRGQQLKILGWCELEFTQRRQITPETLEIDCNGSASAAAAR